MEVEMSQLTTSIKEITTVIIDVILCVIFVASVTPKQQSVTDPRG